MPSRTVARSTCCWRARSTSRGGVRGPDAYTFETILHPPELFGIISLATDLPHSATCRARTDCLVAHLDRPAFVELHHEHSALGARFEHMLARQLVRDLRRVTRDLLDAFESGDPKALRSSIGGLS